jgi:hypothetical protein
MSTPNRFEKIHNVNCETNYEAASQKENSTSMFSFKLDNRWEAVRQEQLKMLYNSWGRERKISVVDKMCKPKYDKSQYFVGKFSML